MLNSHFTHSLSPCQIQPKQRQIKNLKKNIEKKVTFKGGDMDASGSSKDEMKKGPWSEAEDEVLRQYVQNNGERNWNNIRKDTGLRRSGKSCRMRWTNHLRPYLKRGPFSAKEEQIVVDLHGRHGNKWALMALKLPGRTDNEIKNFWNTRAKKLNRLGLAVNQPLALQPTPPTLPPQALAASSLFPTRTPVSSPPPPPPYLLSSSNYLSRMMHNYPLPFGNKAAPSAGNYTFSLTNISQSPFLKSQPNRSVSESFNGFGEQLQSNPYMPSSSTLSFPNRITALTQQFSTQTVQPSSINLVTPNINVRSVFDTPTYVQNGVYDTDFNIASLFMNTPHLQNPYFSSNAGTSLGGTIQSMQTPQHHNSFFSSNTGTSHGGTIGSMQTPQHQNPYFSSNVEGSSSHCGPMELTNNDPYTYFTPHTEKFNSLLDSADHFKEDCTLNYDPVKGSITFSEQGVMDKGKRKIDVYCSSSSAINAESDVNPNDSKVILEDWDDIDLLDDNFLDAFSSQTPSTGLEAIADHGFGLHLGQSSDDNTQMVELGQDGQAPLSGTGCN